ncbi:hypothetical protein BD779DRAFT_1477509 [Infundibulicybe gibba]|nr:hypothetical protein BD779DRAFT_1477509 [Infundibulicybe gibba]
MAALPTWPLATVGLPSPVHSISSDIARAFSAPVTGSHTQNNSHRLFSMEEGKPEGGNNADPIDGHWRNDNLTNNGEDLFLAPAAFSKPGGGLWAPPDEDDLGVMQGLCKYSWQRVGYFDQYLGEFSDHRRGTSGMTHDREPGWPLVRHANRERHTGYLFDYNFLYHDPTSAWGWVIVSPPGPEVEP